MFQTARKLSLILAVLVGFATTAAAQQDLSKADAERGQTLIKEGKFQEALEAYVKAANADPKNPEYPAVLGQIRQIVRAEGIAADDTDPRWKPIVHQLHGFYLGRGLAKKALPLDRKLHAKEGTKESAYGLAMTLGELKEFSEASLLLGEVLKKGEDAGVRVLRAIFLARLGKAEEARADVAKTPPALKDSGVLYNRACAYALLGDKAKAAADLANAFKQTPADQLAASKEWSKKDPDLAALHGSPEFAKALEVASTCGDSAQGGCEDGEGKKDAGCGTKSECDGCDQNKNK